jgi:hypothetical protein
MLSQLRPSSPSQEPGEWAAPVSARAPQGFTSALGRTRGSAGPTAATAVRPAPGPARVGDVLDRALRSLGTPSVSGVEVIFERWAEVVGGAMAARTKPLRIDGEVLVVGCDEPAVATHVRFLQAELVERLGQLSGDRHIDRIEVRVTQARPGSGAVRRPPRRAGRVASGAATGRAGRSPRR